MPKELNFAKRFSLQNCDELEKGYISSLSVSDQQKSVSEGSLKVWSELPVKIRQDPSMALFQNEHEKLHGKGKLPSEEIREVSQNQEKTDNQCNSNSQESEFNGITKETKFVSVSLNRKNREPDKKVSVASTNAYSEPENYRKYTRMVSMLVIWFIVTSILASTGDKNDGGTQLVVPAVGIKEYTLRKSPNTNQFKLGMTGAFRSRMEIEGNETNYLEIQFQIIDRLNDSFLMNVLQVWKVPTVPPNIYERSKLQTSSQRFELSAIERGVLDEPSKTLQLVISKRSNPETYDLFSMEIFYYPEVIDIHTGALFGAMILVIMYVLIIWEIVHRTFASIISAIMAVAVLAIFDEKPTMQDIMIWMDCDTLLLLFSMMTLVAVLTETGVFDYIAVLAFEARLCEVMKLDPVPILMAIVVHANTGGTMTPIGDPPNLIITNNNYIQNNGVNFITFVAHMVPGVIIVIIQTSLHFRFIFRDIHNLRLNESEDLKNLRREISVWKRAAGSISSYSKDADVVRCTLLKKVRVLRGRLKKMEGAGTVSTDDYNHTLENLRTMYPIKNKLLLIKSASVLFIIIFTFFVESVPALRRLSLGWIALLGVILLLIISGRNDMDILLSRIEWTTLLFFACMFVTMESLSQLGFITWIGQQTENIILSVPQESRLACAILLVLWISAISSAFVDSIPITAMMVKVVVGLAENPKLNLPIQPLVWALSFGPCLGGNGTVYGASANVVCAGIAEQHGYKISFMKYFRIVFPMMLSSVIVITIYLLFSHVLFDWH